MANIANAKFFRESLMVGSLGQILKLSWRLSGALCIAALLTLQMPASALAAGVQKAKPSSKAAQKVVRKHNKRSAAKHLKLRGQPVAQKSGRQARVALAKHGRMKPHSSPQLRPAAARTISKTAMAPGRVQPAIAKSGFDPYAQNKPVPLAESRSTLEPEREKPASEPRLRMSGVTPDHQATPVTESAAAPAPVAESVAVKVCHKDGKVFLLARCED